MKTIPIYIESRNGHDTLNVPEDEVQNEVEKQLKDDKWVTLEKENGNTEILTERDIHKTITDDITDKTINEEWAEKFKDVKSATITGKAKGG